MFLSNVKAVKCNVLKNVSNFKRYLKTSMTNYIFHNFCNRIIQFFCLRTVLVIQKFVLINLNLVSLYLSNKLFK